MIKDIEQDKINMVITKDLSRLGRDYIGTGEYIEKFFPEKNIRYISINDGIDTFNENNGNNDIAPFKSILNDMYSKDLSKKIKTALHTMQKQGKWVGSSVALGYMRSPEDKNKLIINEKEAEIVKTIFDLAYSGKKLVEIRRYLIDNNIPTSRKIRYNKETFWEKKTIKHILNNPIYIGTSIQNRNSRINYKNRKLKANPKEEWYIVENTHEPIIDKQIFYAIKKMAISEKYSRNEKKHEFLLDGLLICYECKHKIGIRKRADNGRFCMVCNYYRRNSKLKLCTSHGFDYQKLEDKVLEYIRTMFENIDKEKVEIDVKKNKYDYRRIIQATETEIKNINNNIDKMYLDKLNGKISEEMYERIFKDMNYKLELEKKKYDELIEKTEISEDKEAEEIRKIINEVLSMKVPTKEFMRVLINRIELHQDKQIDIVFNLKKLNEINNKQCLL